MIGAGPAAEWVAPVCFVVVAGTGTGTGIGFAAAAVAG